MSFSTKTYSLIARLAACLGCIAMALAAPACGKGKHGKTRALNDDHVTQDNADLETIPEIEAGSRALAILPEPGTIDGPVLVQLFAEEGAQIRYAAFGDIEWSENSIAWNGAQLMYPPFEIYAQSWVDGRGGETFHWKFESASNMDSATGFVDERRLGLNVTSDLRSLVHEQMDFSKLQVIDEENTSSALRDSASDLPSKYDGSNIIRTEVTDEGERFVLEIEFSKPLARSNTVSYGFELSTSGITTQTFGDGAKPSYRVECALLHCALLTPFSSKRIAEIEVDGSRDPAMILHVEKSWLDASFRDQNNIVIRAFSADSRRTGVAYDRTAPMFTQQSFKSRKTTIVSANDRPIDFRILAHDDVIQSEKTELYLSHSAAITPLLERQNRFALDSLGSIPLVAIPHGSKTFSGINSTERGILLGLSDNEQIITRFQLLAHEIAHFQNAGLSRLNERWVQEGFSEWAAERAMYATFSRRAVYRYLRSLRVDSYLRLANSDKAENDLPLSAWKNLESNHGYEKVAVFFQILDQIVGTETLRQAQLIARNIPMDGEEFRRTLEKLSGKDLSELFQYWVNDLAVSPKYSAETLLADVDQDGLLKIDEDMIGTSDREPDTDRDGFSDLEEFLTGESGTENRLHDAIASYPSTDAALQNFVHLGSNAGEKIFYSIQNAQNDFSLFNPYLRGLPLKAPVTLWATDKKGNVKELRWQRTVTDSANATQTYVAEVVKENEGPLHGAPAAVDVAKFSIESPQAPAGIVHDASGDIPDAYSALDVTKFELTNDEEYYKFQVSMKGDADKFGEFGKTELQFSSQSFARSSFPVYHGMASFAVTGTQVQTNFPTSLGSAISIENDVRLSLNGNVVTLIIRKQKLLPLINNGTFAQVCLRTLIRADDNQSLIDRAGCIPLRWSSARRHRIAFAENNGTPHTVDVFSGEALASGDAESLTRASAASIIRMAKLLGHPLDDRSYWQIHLEANAQGELRTDANEDFGIFLSSRIPDASYPLSAYGNQVLTLLARTVLADVRNRLGSETENLWAREMTIAWLRLSASQAIFGEAETRSIVKSFNAGHFLCLYNNQCFENSVIRSFYPDEARQGLSQWTNLYDETLNQQKSVMAAMDLISIMGNQAFSQFAATMFNSSPTTAQALSSIRAAAPDRVEEISLWAARWGITSNSIDVSAIQARFQSHANGLYEIESLYRTRYP